MAAVQMSVPLDLTATRCSWLIITVQRYSSVQAEWLHMQLRLHQLHPWQLSVVTSAPTCKSSAKEAALFCCVVDVLQRELLSQVR
jgi:hypothetical protein